MRSDDGVDRRRFLSGGLRPRAAAGQREPGQREHCISSAVVVVRPERAGEMAERLAAMPGVEVRGRGNNRLVLVLEGPGSGAVGGLLAEIAVMDGVIAANMVFEHVEPTDVRGV